MAAVSAAAEHGRRAQRRELEGQRGGGGVGGGKGATGASISPLIQIIEKIFGRDVERWTVIWHTINLSSAAPRPPQLPPPQPLPRLARSGTKSY